MLANTTLNDSGAGNRDAAERTVSWRVMKFLSRKGSVESRRIVVELSLKRTSQKS